MFIQHKNTVGRQIVITSESAGREKIVHRFVKLDSHGRILVIEEEINSRVSALPQAHFDGVGNFQQRK